MGRRRGLRSEGHGDSSVYWIGEGREALNAAARYFLAHKCHGLNFNVEKVFTWLDFWSVPTTPLTRLPSLSVLFCVRIRILSPTCLNTT